MMTTDKCDSECEHLESVSCKFGVSLRLKPFVTPPEVADAPTRRTV
jgi:hypothetical protein